MYAPTVLQQLPAIIPSALNLYPWGYAVAADNMGSFGRDEYEKELRELLTYTCPFTRTKPCPPSLLGNANISVKKTPKIHGCTYMYIFVLVSVQVAKMTDKFLKHAVYNFMFIYFPGSPLGVPGFLLTAKATATATNDVMNWSTHTRGKLCLIVILFSSFSWCC